MPQKHLVQVNLREKLNFHDFYFQLRGAGYEDLTMIKSGIFYCINISKKLLKILCFMQNHELLVFYCGHQSKVHRQKWVSTNRQLIVANLIYITLVGTMQLCALAHLGCMLLYNLDQKMLMLEISYLDFEKFCLEKILQSIF